MSEIMKKLPNEEILKMLGFFQLVEKSVRWDRGLQNPGACG